MRMHFNLLVKKISSKITLSGLVKLLASACAYYEICENKDDLIDLIFVHVIPFFCYNQQVIDQVEKYKNTENLRHQISAMSNTSTSFISLKAES